MSHFQNRLTRGVILHSSKEIYIFYIVFLCLFQSDRNINGQGIFLIVFIRWIVIKNIIATKKFTFLSCRLLWRTDRHLELKSSYASIKPFFISFWILLLTFTIKLLCYYCTFVYVFCFHYIIKHSFIHCKIITNTAKSTKQNIKFFYFLHLLKRSRFTFLYTTGYTKIPKIA